MSTKVICCQLKFFVLLCASEIWSELGPQSLNTDSPKVYPAHYPEGS